MQQRLELFLKEEGLSKSEFAEKINVSKAIISHIISGRNQPGRKFIMNTMTAFPYLNIDWLLYGKGEMYSKNVSIQEKRIFNTDLFNDDIGTVKTSPATPDKLTVESDARKDSLPSFSGKNRNRSIRKIIVLYDDNSFEEFS